MAEETAEADVRKFSPAAHLLIFTLMQICTYFDRGALSQVLDIIKEAYALDNTQLGLLGSIFTAGYMVASPVVAVLGQKSRYAPVRCIGGGLLFWCLGNAMTSLLPSEGHGCFVPLLVLRAMTGVGEAGFVCLAPPIIDDSAPPAKRGLYLGVYFMFIFVGQAMGYIFGGTVASMLEVWSGVKYLFLVEAVLMLPLALFALLSARRFRVGAPDAGDDSFATAVSTTRRRPSVGSFSILEQTRVRSLSEVQAAISDGRSNGAAGIFRQSAGLFANPVFVVCCLGYSAYNFVVGGVAYWGPHYVKSVLSMAEAASGYAFGGVTVIAGVIGTWTGSLILDRSGMSPEAAANRLETAARITLAFAVVAWPFLLATAWCSGQGLFFGFLLFGESCLFAIYTPICVVLLEAVPETMRGAAMAISALSIHLLGDMPSQAIVGSVADQVSHGASKGKEYAEGMRSAMIFLAAFHVVGIALFAATYVIIRRRGRQFPEARVNLAGADSHEQQPAPEAH